MVGAATRKPTAVIVVAAWHEGVPPRLAARVTYTADVSKPARVTVTAAGPHEIAAAVARWLREVEAAE